MGKNIKRSLLGLSLFLSLNLYGGRHDVNQLDRLKEEEYKLRTSHLRIEEEIILKANDNLIENLTKQLIFLRNNREEERLNEGNELIQEIKNRKLFKQNFYNFMPAYEYKGEYYIENYYKVVTYEPFNVNEEFLVSIADLGKSIELFQFKRIALLKEIFKDKL